MKPQDLRMGNWINKLYAPIYKEQDSYWAECPVNVSDFKGVIDYPDNLKPIPITPKWLVKFGFEKRPHLNDWFIEIGHQGSILIFSGISIFKCESNESKIFLCNLEFIHEIQNLCSALGKELELKEQ